MRSLAEGGRRFRSHGAIVGNRDAGQAPRSPANRLRIAIISHFLPTEGRKGGGVDCVAHDLAEGLARRGHSVVVWSYNPKPEGASYVVRPLPFRSVAISKWGQRLLMGYFGNFLPLLLDLRAADALVAHGDSMFLPLLGKPVVRIMHGSSLAEALFATSAWRKVNCLGMYLQELVAGLTIPGCVAVSQNTRYHNGFVRRVIPNGIDTSLFSPAPTAKTKAPSILFVGTLQGRKRGHLLLRWFEQEILPRCPGATLWMVSEPGPQQSGVQYFNGIGRSQLAQLYRQAWIYASPSRYEGFGLPYVEAMASGTPVVASPNWGSREVLGEGRFGVLADDDSFADAVKRLLDDSAERQKWTDRGLERAREYSHTTMIDRYEEVLLNLCGRERPSRA